MHIKLIKNGNGSFSLLKEDLKEIENYSFENTIDFKQLMSFLIEKELTEKIELVKDLVADNLDDQEKKLISLIETIVQMYNDRVDAFNKPEESESN